MDALTISNVERIAAMARILLIDDDQTIRELLAEFLTDEGHEVHTADHPQDVLGGPVTHSWQLVITGPSGSRWNPALPEVQQLVAAHPGVPVVLFTAHAEACGVDITKLGLAAVWLKPMDLTELGESVEGLLIQ